jgi:hypothetical protein
MGAPSKGLSAAGALPHFSPCFQTEIFLSCDHSHSSFSLVIDEMKKMLVAGC